MRRYTYPYGRYVVKDESLEKIDGSLRTIVEDLGLHVVKDDPKNEGEGVLLIAVDKTISQVMKEPRAAGHLDMLISLYPFDLPAEKDMDQKHQRVGIEFYLWPSDDGALLEIFVLPYMEHFNKKEIPGITETKDEEATDWLLCEHIWEKLIPKVVERIGAEEIKRVC